MNNQQPMDNGCRFRSLPTRAIWNPDVCTKRELSLGLSLPAQWLCLGRRGRASSASGTSIDKYANQPVAARILASGSVPGITARSEVNERRDLDSAGWRRGRDSNPRYSLRPYDALAKRCLQPLGHLSGASLMHLIARAGQFGSACFRSNIPSDLRKEAGLFPRGRGVMLREQTRSGASGTKCKGGWALGRPLFFPRKLNLRDDSMAARAGRPVLAEQPDRYALASHDSIKSVSMSEAPR